jgi:hypothetical protein
VLAVNQAVASIFDDEEEVITGLPGQADLVGTLGGSLLRQEEIILEISLINSLMKPQQFA